MMANSERAVSPPADAVPEHQRLVDELQAKVRGEAPGQGAAILRAVPAEPEPSRDPLDHRIAAELEEIRRGLDDLGGILVAEPILLERYVTQLQAIDRINQLLGHLARVLAAEQKDVAVDHITLQDLRMRLQRKAVPAG